MCANEYGSMWSNYIDGALQVGTKTDKAVARTVKYEEGEALAQRHGCSFCEVSAKTRHNVRKPFIELVDQIVGSPQLMNAAKTRQAGLKLEESNNSWTSCSC